MVEELNKIKKDVEKAIGRVGAEYAYATALLEKLKEAESEEPKGASRDMKKAIHLFVWLGRGERDIDRFETRIIDELTELGKILPDTTKDQEEKLLKELEIVHAKLVKAFSRYTGELKDELNDIRTEEALLQKLESDGESTENLKAKLAHTFKNVENEIEELINWIQSTQAILKKIEGFESDLEKMAV
jgi:hypothetical protein